MGQSSSPLLNKYGCAMYWNSMWDNKVIFTKKLKEDIFINMFLPLIFNKSLNNSMYKINQKNYFFFKSTLPLDLQKNFKTFRNDYNLKKKFMSRADSTGLNAYYISGKIWVLRFQRWLILVFSIYSPKYAVNVETSRLQLLKNSRKKDSKWWFFLKNYANNLIQKESSISTTLNKLILKKKVKEEYPTKKIKKIYFHKINKINTYLKSRLFLLKLKKKKNVEKKSFFFFKKLSKFYLKEIKIHYKNESILKKKKKIERNIKKQAEKKNELKFQSWQMSNHFNLLVLEKINPLSENYKSKGTQTFF